MAKQKKKRKKLLYEISVNDWEVYHSFNAEKNMRDIGDGLFWEISELMLKGRLITPILKSATKVKIRIHSKPNLDKHWKESLQGHESEIIGTMEVPRGETTLEVYTWLPNRMVQNIFLAVNSDKIKYVLVHGEELKWRQGNLFSISLATNVINLTDWLISKMETTAPVLKISRVLSPGSYRFNSFHYNFMDIRYHARQSF